jgi:DNA-binding NarL/FixJ family response regulator
MSLKLPQPITIYLVDDHPIVLKGISNIIDLEDDLHVVGCTTQSTRILDEVRRLRPQVVVVDLAMPEIPGGEIIRLLKSMRGVDTAIVVFTMHKDISYVAQALKDGALGFVLKDADSSHLVKAIRAAARGKVYLSPPFTQETIWEYEEQVRRSKDGVDLDRRLTRREREVLILVAQGYTNREIAQRLGISVRTVEKHRFNMMKKMGFRNKAEAIQYALRTGLITADESVGQGVWPQLEDERT